MALFTKSAANVFSPTTAGGVPRGADMGEAQVWGVEVEHAISAVTTGLSMRDAVDFATTANITLSGSQTVDGQSSGSGKRALVKDQSSPAQNGIYVTSSSGAWTRATDADSSSEMLGATVFVKAGMANGGLSFACATPAPITIGTTHLTFVQVADRGDNNLTKDDVGLDQVDNTSDADKPVSTAQAAADLAIALAGMISLGAATGSGTAYAASSGKSLASYTTDSMFLLTPHTDNTGSATLNIDSVGAVTIADGNGQSLVAGMLKSGVPVILRKEASYFRMIGSFIHPEVRGNMRLYGPAWIVGSVGALDRYQTTGDAAPRERFIIGDDYFDFYAGGDGTNAAAFVCRIAANGNITTVGQFLADSGRPAWHASNQPYLTKVGADGIDVARIMSGPKLRYRNIANTLPRNINEADPIFVSGRDIGKVITVTGASRIIDLTGLPNGAEVDIITDASSASATIFGGISANWRGRTAGHHSLTIGADTWITVKCLSASDYIFVEHRGTITGSNNTAQAARDWTIPIIGESHAEQFAAYGGFAGIQERFGELSLSKSIWPVQCGFGGAAIIKDYEANPGGVNYFWDPAAGGSPGPRATTARDRILAAISAGQPDPTDALLIIGENEIDNLTTSTIVNNWKAAAEDMIEWFRTELSLPDLRFHWVPLGSDEYSGILDATYTAIREAQLQVIASVDDVLQGPEMYDLSRAYEDTHLDFEGQFQLGRRFADHIDVAVNAADRNLGPHVVGVTEINSSQYEIEISADDLPILLPDVVLRDWVSGMGFINSGTPIGQTQKTIKQFAWAYSGSTYKLTVYLASAATGARLVYPWGKGADLRTGVITDAYYKPLRSYAG